MSRGPRPDIEALDTLADPATASGGRSSAPAFDDTHASVEPRLSQPTLLDAAGNSRRTRPPRAISELDVGAHVGRYRIEGLLGRGGMGVVYAAHDPTLGRRVAIKLLHSTYRGAAAAHLVHEAKALARLQDPNVVTVYDAGEVDGQVFLAMQLVEGEELGEALARRRPPAAVVLAWFVEAGRGLCAAHAAGLVHRDFKPSNVLIDRAGRIAVTDFGVALSLDAPDDLSRAALVGTPLYMSPEQLHAEPATERSDQFSFCVALWEALYDEHPYLGRDRARSPLAIAHVLVDAPLRAAPRTPRVPRRVTDALARGLARDPAARWPDLGALLAELAPARRSARWPLALGLGAVAVIGGGTLALRPAARPPSCDHTQATRLAAVWAPPRQAALAAAFARSGRGHAAAAAAEASAALSAYARRWQALAVDVCTQGRAGGAGPADELVRRREACLDHRLSATRTLLDVMTTEVRPAFVDHAGELVAGLPDLAGCADAAALLAGPGGVPLVMRARVEPLERELTAATARLHAGALAEAKAALVEITTRADAVGWGPLRVAAHRTLGEALLQRAEPARPELVLAARLATELELPRDAARAWALAGRAAGDGHARDAATAYHEVAAALAERLDDPALSLEVDVIRGASLAASRQYAAAATTCRAVLAAASAQLGDHADIAERARACLISVLPPLADWPALEPLLGPAIARVTAELGPEHPRLIALLTARASMEWQRGDHAAAAATTTQVLALARKVHGPAHVQVAQALATQAGYAQAASQYDEARRGALEALAIAEALDPRPAALIARLQRDLGLIAGFTGDAVEAMRLLDLAIAGLRPILDPDSIEIPVIQLMYAQFLWHQGEPSSIDRAVRMLADAGAVLTRAGDKRAPLARGIHGKILETNERWEEARLLYDQALAEVDLARIDPQPLGMMRLGLSRALIATDGDNVRARALAGQARADLVRANDVAGVATVDAWLASRKLR